MQPCRADQLGPYSPLALASAPLTQVPLQLVRSFFPNSLTTVTAGPQIVKREDVSASEYAEVMGSLHVAYAEGITPVAFVASSIDSYKADHTVTGKPGFQASVDSMYSCRIFYSL